MATLGALEIQLSLSRSLWQQMISLLVLLIIPLGGIKGALFLEISILKTSKNISSRYNHSLVSIYKMKHALLSFHYFFKQFSGMF